MATPENLENRIDQLEKTIRRMQKWQTFTFVLFCLLGIAFSFLGLSQSRLGMAFGELHEAFRINSHTQVTADRAGRPSLQMAMATPENLENRVDQFEKTIGRTQILQTTMFVVVCVFGIAFCFLVVSLSRLGMALGTLLGAFRIGSHTQVSADQGGR